LATASRLFKKEKLDSELLKIIHISNTSSYFSHQPFNQHIVALNTVALIALACF